MIKDNQWQEIAKRTGISAESLKAAISSEAEEQLQFSNHSVFTDEELETLKENVKKTGYADGKSAGIEMEFKRLRDAYGIDGIEGKSMEKLIEKYAEKKLKEANAEPSQKIKELTSDMEKLRMSLTEKEAEISKVSNELNGKIKKITIDNQILGMLPSDVEGLSKEDLFLLYNGKREIRATESGIEIVDKKTNEILKDKMQKSITLADDINAFLEERKIPQAGRGGNDQNNFGKNGIETLLKRSDAEKYFDENNIPLTERATILQKAMKNEGFNMAG